MATNGVEMNETNRENPSVPSNTDSIQAERFGSNIRIQAEKFGSNSRIQAERFGSNSSITSIIATSKIKYETISRESSAIHLTRSLSTSMAHLLHDAIHVVGPKGEDVYPWVNVLLVAFAVGTIEVLPVLCLAWSIPLKYDFLNSMLRQHGLGIMFLTNWAISVVLVVFGVLLTTTTPIASGSGIPQIIAYLFNGKKIDKQIFSPEMVLVKMIGVTCGLTGGLVIGREGPAIAMGAGIADSTNRLINKTIRVVTGRKIPFDGQVKSNIVMMGATAGFASAFRAPIGGLLYCVEELATHWDIKSHMTVGAQTFLVATVAAFSTATMINVLSGGAGLEFSSIVIYDENDVKDNKGTGFEYIDIPMFMALAVVCGIVSGINAKMSNWMRGYPFRDASRRTMPRLVMYSFAVATVTAVFLSLGPLIRTRCRDDGSNDQPDDDHRRFLSGGGGSRAFVQYTCPDGQYSQLASLCLTGEEAVIRHLLARDAEEFDIQTLCIFFLLYFPLTLLTKLLPIPAGSFVPNLLLGALTGRIFGEISQLIFPDDIISAPGVYALIGAGATLSAWTRTMMAIVVTLLEVSGEMGLAQPLILAVIISRSVATGIAHHSFTHELFYLLVDDGTGGSGSTILHPNDWMKPESKKRRDSINNASIEETDEQVGTTGPRQWKPSLNHGATHMDSDDEDDHHAPQEGPQIRVRLPSTAGEDDDNAEEEVILSKNDIQFIQTDGNSPQIVLDLVNVDRRRSFNSMVPVTEDGQCI